MSVCGHFLFLCLVVNKVQWFGGGLVHVCTARISSSVCNGEPLSESDGVRERKRENGLGNGSLFLSVAAIGLVQGNCSR